MNEKLEAYERCEHYRTASLVGETRSNPRWYAPLFSLLMIIGLIWVVAWYLTGRYPIPGICAWNLLVGFAIIMIGFLMTMWWR